MEDLVLAPGQDHVIVIEGHDQEITIVGLDHVIENDPDLGKDQEKGHDLEIGKGQGLEIGQGDQNPKKKGRMISPEIMKLKICNQKPKKSGPKDYKSKKKNKRS